MRQKGRLSTNFAVLAIALAFIFTPLSVSSGLTRPPKTLTDPNATSETKSLMSFLVDYYGMQVLSGQWDLGEISYIQSITGKQPAVGCFDLMEYSPSRIEHGANPTGLAESYMNWANTGGGMVSLCWHWNAPTDLIDDTNHPWWSGFYTFATTFDIQATLADPNGSRYQLVLRDLDAIAVQLKKFQDTNLPVLWRPLHEASGGWFWWGAKGPTPFIQLWQLMHDRFVNYHHLHNLIWVYTVGDAAWYPGDAYVDIVGMDIYPSDQNASMAGFWQDTQSRHEGVKLVALSESGILPNPDKIRQDKVWWSWFSVWSGFIHNPDLTFLNTVYHDEDIITLDELIDWKHYPLEGGAPVIAITQPAEAAEFDEGSDITISAAASDPCGAVVKVEFYKNDVKLGEDTNSPFGFTWTNVPQEHYVLSAVATDNNGLRSDSQDVNITVGTPPPPTIVRYEAENAVSDGPALSTSFPGYSGTGSRYFNSSYGTGITFTVTSGQAGNFPLTIRYLITAGWGPKTNTVLVNGAEVWSPEFTNTNSAWSNFEFGEISLKSCTNIVRIQHNWGWFYVDYIEIELPSSSGPMPPTVSIDSPANNAIFAKDANITIIARSCDTDGSITKVEFFQNATKLGEDTTAPYSYSWNNAPTGHYTLTAKATDDDANSTTSLPINITVLGVQGTGAILSEWWTGIPGTSVSDLTSDTNYPGNSSRRELLLKLQGPTNWADDYGTRIRGYLNPVTTDDYTFSIAADDSAELWLATDDNPANIALIANTPGSPQSSPIALAAGQKYYIEVLHKEGTGTDNISVSWQGPAFSEQVIDGIYLSPCCLEFRDFSDFARQWKKYICNPGNDWCSGADKDRDYNVGLDDLSTFADAWLAAE